MKTAVRIGIIVGIIGIAGIIVSQSVPFTKVVSEPGNEFAMGMSFRVEDKKTKNTVLFCGIALLIGGGICALFGNSPKSGK